MADIWSQEKRSQVMARIKSKDTLPEVRLRSILHKSGYRFRKNVKNLLGKPDIVMPKYKTIIFVHGCFWHGHKNCIDGRLPKTNIGFWKNKIEGNRNRDLHNIAKLRHDGWHVIQIWECTILKNPQKVLKRINLIINSIKGIIKSQ